MLTDVIVGWAGGGAEVSLPKPPPQAARARQIAAGKKPQTVLRDEGTDHPSGTTQIFPGETNYEGFGPYMPKKRAKQYQSCAFIASCSR